MGKISVFLAEGFEEIEALTVVDILRRANQEVETVSVGADKRVVGSHQIPVEADCLYEEVDFSQVSMLVLPGGMPGTLNLKKKSELMERLKDFAKKEDKWLCAICAAPSILGELGILEGKEAISYPGYEVALKGAKILPQKVVRDGNIITAKGMGSSIAFSLELVKVLVDEKEAVRIQQSIGFGHEKH
ncbi:MAG TPA: DJ-1 family glyoxalase III [Lachnospiraceae bacterium]